MYLSLHTNLNFHTDVFYFRIEMLHSVLHYNLFEDVCFCGGDNNWWIYISSINQLYLHLPRILHAMNRWILVKTNMALAPWWKNPLFFQYQYPTWLHTCMPMSNLVCQCLILQTNLTVKYADLLHAILRQACIFNYFITLLVYTKVI